MLNEGSMDLFPELGEPGILDELFYFGPLFLQIILGMFCFWLTGCGTKRPGWGIRFVSIVGMVLGADLLLLIIFVVVFKNANPTL